MQDEKSIGPQGPLEVGGAALRALRLEAKKTLSRFFLFLPQTFNLHPRSATCFALCA